MKRLPPGILLVFGATFLLGGETPGSETPGSETPGPETAVRTVALTPAHPFFVPTHPRVTTTVRFPGEIGAPDGSVAIFVEDATKQPGEYLVSWEQGDSYFTVAPLKQAQMANLNVPYLGRTYVFFFYPVTEPMQAVASVNLVAAAPSPETGAGAPAAPAEPTAPAPESISSRTPRDATPLVRRQTSPPPPSHVDASPARLLGLLDRLKVIHATPAGPVLAELVRAMQVQVTVTTEAAGAAIAGPNGPPGTLRSGMNDAGLYQIILLRVVRDPRTNCLGFVCLVRNTSDQVLTFDVNSFGARAGMEYLSQRISDATPVLRPGEQAPAYFVVVAPPNDPLTGDNAWKITVDLVSPRINPGAALAGKFGATSPVP